MLSPSGPPALGMAGADSSTTPPSPAPLDRFWRQPTLQAAAGALQSALKPAAGLGTLAVTNGLTAQGNALVTGSASGEATVIGFAVTLFGQLLKQLIFTKLKPHWDQNTWLLPILTAIALVVAWFLWHNADSGYLITWGEAQQAFKSAVLGIQQGIANYKSWNLTGWGGLEPAIDATVGRAQRAAANAMTMPQA